AENVMSAHALIKLAYAIEKKERFDNAIKTYKQRHKLPNILGFTKVENIEEPHVLKQLIS
ncbi:MAG: hypothetical protein V1722_03890, partial [Candidatus Micrarchaeota archaeon]